MKSIRFWICLAVFFHCGLVLGAEVPSSRRSKEVSTRLTPQLSADLSQEKLQLGAPVFMRIFKDSKELEVWVEGENGWQLFRTYPVCTYSGDLGPKLKEGDNQAPEGFYFVNPVRMNPNSRFHLSFNLGYPNAYDRFHGRTGSALMVHGNCVSIGCFAMTDDGIEEIYVLAAAALTEGQEFFRVHVFPFRMNEENMKKHLGWDRKPQWRDFWENLKTGYDFFEETGRPPNVEVKQGRYVFGE